MLFEYPEKTCEPIEKQKKIFHKFKTIALFLEDRCSLVQKAKNKQVEIKWYRYKENMVKKIYIEAK